MIKRLFVFTLCFLSLQAYSQDDTLFCKQVSALQTLIKDSHYSPKPVNDSLSKGVYHLFLSGLDNYNRFFLESDIETFKEDVLKIDDYITTNDCSFIDKYITILQKRIEDSKQYVEALNNENFDYTGKDTLYFKPGNSSGYFKNIDSAKRYWSKRMRYQIVEKLIEEDSVFDNVKRNFKSLEATLKPKLIQNQICELDEILHKNGNIDTYVKELFLNALVGYQDPNSSFFNDSDKVLFETSVSNNQLTFGITTAKNNEGEIIIAYITPGSAAFKDGNFEENDVLKTLTSGDEILETYCVSNEDITAFTNDEKHNTITFKIKKQNGSIHNIELTKTVTKVEENTVRGYVVENGSNFGYIEIPGFYTDLDSPNGLGLANDVAKELYKLEKEDIKGLILDLRFNGGGSMKEAADLSGMFINRGPLSVLKYNNGDTFTIKDANRGSLFNKPIIVLINNYSASASEFFAAALQDYNRAIIVGSPSHGKSSAQVILPLSETNDLGFCKLTVEKFYRVNGKSHQSIGVIPDIKFPSIYDNLKTSEQYERFALKNDSIEVSLRHIPLRPIALKSIKTNSENRIANDDNFKTIKLTNERLLNDFINKTYQYPITIDGIYTDIENYNNLWNEFYSNINKAPLSISARNTLSTAEVIEYNTDDAKANAIILDNIANDIYIDEACSILLDYINSKTTN